MIKEKNELTHNTSLVSSDSSLKSETSVIKISDYLHKNSEISSESASSSDDEENDHLSNSGKGSNSRKALRKADSLAKEFRHFLLDHIHNKHK